MGDAVNTQAQVGVLLGAADGQHATVVVAQALLDLHPVHLGDAHGGSRGLVGKPPSCSGLRRMSFH